MCCQQQDISIYSTDVQILAALKQSMCWGRKDVQRDYLPLCPWCRETLSINNRKWEHVPKVWFVWIMMMLLHHRQSKPSWKLYFISISSLLIRIQDFQVIESVAQRKNGLNGQLSLLLNMYVLHWACNSIFNRVSNVRLFALQGKLSALRAHT